MARVFVQHLPPKPHRIYTRRMREFINKTLFKEGIMRMPHRSPGTKGYCRLDDDMRRYLIRNFIAVIVQTLDRGLVRPCHRQTKSPMKQMLPRCTRR